MRLVILLLLIFVGCESTSPSSTTNSPQTTSDDTSNSKEFQSSQSSQVAVENSSSGSVGSSGNSAVENSGSGNTVKNSNNNSTVENSGSSSSNAIENSFPTTSEPSQVLSVKTQPAKTQPAKTQPAKTQPAKTQPAKTQPAKTQPVKTQPVKTQPVKTQPSAKNNNAQIAKEADTIRKNSRNLTGSFHPTAVIQNFHFKEHLGFLVRSDARDDRGYNMLMLACEFGYLYIVQDILQQNAQSTFLNHQSLDGGKTALMIAADLGYIEIVQLLMINGANGQLTRDNGKSAIDFAQYRYQNSTGQEKEKYKRILNSLQGTEGY